MKKIKKIKGNADETLWGLAPNPDLGVANP
jgi:hypothetical protein